MKNGIIELSSLMQLSIALHETECVDHYITIVLLANFFLYPLDAV